MKLSPIPHGVLILTLLYVGLVLLIVYAVPSDDCLDGREEEDDEPCDDTTNYILGWATEYWIGLHMILFAIQLQWFVQRPVNLSAVMALACMGIAYILGGIQHSVLGDDASRAIYSMLVCRFTFMTISVQQVYQFVRQLIQRYFAVAFSSSDSGGRLRFSLHVGFFLVALSWMATTGGYIWCATETDDEDETTTSTTMEDHECWQLASAAELSWYCTYSFVWIPVGILLRRIILELGESTESEQPRRVYGVFNSTAAVWLAIIPWTFGMMLIVWSDILDSLISSSFLESNGGVYDIIYGAAISHYGMLLSFFLFHNIAYSLPCGEAVVPCDSASNQAGADQHSIAGMIIHDDNYEDIIAAADEEQDAYSASDSEIHPAYAW